MLRNSEYIYNNIIIADEINTTKKYCKKAQEGVDLSLKEVREITSPGYVLKDKTFTSKTSPIMKREFIAPNGETYKGYYLPKGTYIIELNEGCKFGPNDTGYIILRSSFNRSGTSIQSALWDSGYTSQNESKINTMSIRMTVDTDKGIFIEENSRVAQLIVFENEDTEGYNGQFQGGQKVSKLVRV